MSKLEYSKFIFEKTNEKNIEDCQRVINRIKSNDYNLTNSELYDLLDDLEKRL